MVSAVQGLNICTLVFRDGQWVYELSNVSLEVYPGEMVAVVGRRNSGNSSLIRVLGCLQRPYTGQVLVEGGDVSGLNDDQLAWVATHKFGFLDDDPNLVPHDTAMENVEASLKDAQLDAYDRRHKGREALRLVGLADSVDKKPRHVSSRQRKFIALARAFVHEPSVLFADEPTKAMDAPAREEVMGVFQKLSDIGRTVVIATADSGVGAYCRRIVKLDQGQIVDDSLVTKRRIIPASRIPGPPSTQRVERDDQLFCPRCSYLNPSDGRFCVSCRYLLTTVQQPEPEELVVGDPIGELRDVSFFAKLGSVSIGKLVPSMEQHRYAAGTRIVRQGEIGDSFYVVRSGHVQVQTESEGRPNVVIARLGPGEGFGEMALLTDQPRFASVVAVTDVEAWRLPKPPFTRLLEETPDLAAYFSQVLNQRLESLQETIYPSV